MANKARDLFEEYKVKAKPKDLLSDNDAYEEENKTQKQHPILYKLAEMLQGNKTLEKAGNIAGKFNQAVEGTGLPNLAKGGFESSANLIRGIGNLIPGVNIPEQHGQEIPETNPMIQRGAELAGNLIGGVPAVKGYQGLQKLSGKLPYLKNAPSAIQNILAGAGTGAAVSPDNRAMGGIVGGVTSAIPEAIKAVKSLKPQNPFDVIQKGYDKKSQAISKQFENAANQVVERGVKKIPIRNKLISEIKELGPKTKHFNSFVDKAKSGDFGALRKLQTELYHRAERYRSSPLGSEQDLADAILESRKEINESIAGHLEKKGHKDIASDIKKSMSQWRNLEETYHSHPKISKLVGENRLVPESTKVLNENSTSMNRLRKAHPEIEQHKNWERNKKLITGLLLGVGGGTLVKKGYNFLTK